MLRMEGAKKPVKAHRGMANATKAQRKDDKVSIFYAIDNFFVKLGTTLSPPSKSPI